MTRMITVVPQKNNFLYSSFEVNTKSALAARLSNYGFVTFVGGPSKSYSGRVKDGFIFLYTAQKFRRKTELTYKFKTNNLPKRTGANNHNFTTKIIYPSHWKIRVYKFPLDRVISAKQEARTFKITIS